MTLALRVKSLSRPGVLYSHVHRAALGLRLP